MLGHSGASVEILSDEVIKRSSDKATLAAQAEVLDYLGDICLPRLKSKGDGWYSMEKLQEIGDVRRNTQQAQLLRRMRDMLRRHVWSRTAMIVATGHYAWKPLLLDWASKTAPAGLVSEELLNALYPADQRPIPCMIHGDPTLANLMERNNRDLCMIDPIKPTGKIPFLKEVDLGKLLQSALGWESVLDPSWPSPSDGGLVRAVLEDEPINVVPKAFFWSAIHCLRILPYAKNERVREWATRQAEAMIGRADRARHWLA